MMPGPIPPTNSGQEFYGSGGAPDVYDKIQRQPALPNVAPPTGTTTGGPPPAAVIPSGPYDQDAPDILKLISGSRFKTPFTVTLKKRNGNQTFKSDAGIKTEPAYALCKETLYQPADLLRILSGMASGVYQPLNNMTVEFQLMLYLAYTSDALDIPEPPPAPIVPEEVEEVEEATADV